MKLLSSIVMSLIFSSTSIAGAVKVVGTVDVPIKLTNSSSKIKVNNADSKRILLLKIELSEKAKATLTKKAVNSQISNSLLSAKSSKKIQLGMGSVPVLDQGNFGSCVTFANTAAVDAVINKGDYVSQLCQLQLGRYLEENGYNPSGWDGSFGGIVLNQMMSFGIVNKSQQRAVGCGGLNDYPYWVTTIGRAMSPEEYHAISEPMYSHYVDWSSIIDASQILIDGANMDNVLNATKASLQAGDRLTLGVLLPEADKGIAGAVGKYHQSNDTWVLTPEIKAAMEQETFFPGHELVITGYDDDAVAIDEQGNESKGLFTLRNSWGANIGDKGDFYISYDYFKALALEVQRIRKVVL